MNDLKTDPLLESKRLLETAAGFAQEYLTQINQRRVAPASADVAALSVFTTAMPESPGDPMGTLEVLHKIGQPWLGAFMVWWWVVRCLPPLGLVY